MMKNKIKNSFFHLMWLYPKVQDAPLSGALCNHLTYMLEFMCEYIWRMGTKTYPVVDGILFIF